MLMTPLAGMAGDVGDVNNEAGLCSWEIDDALAEHRLSESCRKAPTETLLFSFRELVRVGMRSADVEAITLSCFEYLEFPVPAERPLGTELTPSWEEVQP